MNNSDNVDAGRSCLDADGRGLGEQGVQRLSKPDCIEGSHVSSECQCDCDRPQHHSGWRWHGWGRRDYELAVIAEAGAVDLGARREYSRDGKDRARRCVAAVATGCTDAKLPLATCVVGAATLLTERGCRRSEVQREAIANRWSHVPCACRELGRRAQRRRRRRGFFKAVPP